MRITPPCKGEAPTCRPSTSLGATMPALSLSKGRGLPAVALAKAGSRRGLPPSRFTLTPDPSACSGSPRAKSRGDKSGPLPCREALCAYGRYQGERVTPRNARRVSQTHLHRNHPWFRRHAPRLCRASRSPICIFRHSVPVGSQDPSASVGLSLSDTIGTSPGDVDSHSSYLITWVPGCTAGDAPEEMTMHSGRWHPLT